MIPTLALAATLILGPEHRAADLRTGATRADERVLAIDGNRIITYAWPETTLRAVPMEDPKAATTLVTNVSNLAIPRAAFQPDSGKVMIRWSPAEGDSLWFREEDASDYWRGES